MRVVVRPGRNSRTRCFRVANWPGRSVVGAVGVRSRREGYVDRAVQEDMYVCMYVCVRVLASERCVVQDGLVEESERRTARVREGQAVER